MAATAPCRSSAASPLHVSSLGKVYFPDDGFTKGDLMRYYARVAPQILPVIADRPLVLKRTPEGIKGETFFQQKPPEHAPPVVRVETVVNDEGVSAAAHHRRRSRDAALHGADRLRLGGSVALARRLARRNGLHDPRSRSRAARDLRSRRSKWRAG